ncbi:MAG: lipoyl(octanoyl) transferase LipB [Kiritimatiellae bacterium]|nr:lipoyl(octanoyl) transferase LipB [Kiritimatiellia bacterium]
MPGTLKVMDLGAGVAYDEAVARQECLHTERRAGAIPDTLLLLEHAPVYTLGRSAKEENVRWSEAELQRAGIARFQTTRGGDVTYHGPGQLVGYPILHLGERALTVTAYVTALEETLIRALAACGLPGAGRDARNRGVWVGNAKIAAIGIRVSRQVTQHGFALNVNTRLADYGGIVACGLHDAEVTSLAALLGHPADMAAVKRAVVRAFMEVLDYDKDT